MRRSKLLSVLLLASLLQACSSAGASKQEPLPVCTAAPLCKSLGLVKPKKVDDFSKVSEPTQRRIADNNIAIETGCEP